MEPLTYGVDLTTASRAPGGGPMSARSLSALPATACLDNYNTVVRCASDTPHRERPASHRDRTCDPDRDPRSAYVSSAMRPSSALPQRLSNASRISCGMRPRSGTSRPLHRAQSRISDAAGPPAVARFVVRAPADRPTRRPAPMYCSSAERSPSAFLVDKSISYVCPSSAKLMVSPSASPTSVPSRSSTSCVISLWAIQLSKHLVRQTSALAAVSLGRISSGHKTSFGEVGVARDMTCSYFGFTAMVPKLSRFRHTSLSKTRHPQYPSPLSSDRTANWGVGSNRAAR